MRMRYGAGPGNRENVNLRGGRLRDLSIAEPSALQLGKRHMGSEVYAESRIVQAVQTVMKLATEDILKRGSKDASLKSTDTRLMRRKDYMSLLRGRKADADGYLVDHGVLLAEQNNKRLKNADNRFVLSAVSQGDVQGGIATTWRVDSIYDFEPFANASHITELTLAPKMTLFLPDGLSHYMTVVGIAKEFRYYAEWRETWTVVQQAKVAGGRR